MLSASARGWVRPDLMAVSNEHGVDLGTGIVTSAVIRLADQGGTTTLAGTLDAAAALGAVAKAPTPETPAEAVADKSLTISAL